LPAVEEKPETMLAKGGLGFAIAVSEHLVQVSHVIAHPQTPERRRCQPTSRRVYLEPIRAFGQFDCETDEKEPTRWVGNQLVLHLPRAT
jgi:hypothetical protein